MFIRSFLSAILLLGAAISVPTPSVPTVNAGLYAGMPKACPVKGSLFTATDKPLGQQVFVCLGGGVWFQSGVLGLSQGLILSKGILDINTAAIPFLWSANFYTALQRMAGGMTLATKTPQPACTSANRGTEWFLNGGTQRDQRQICLWTGSVFAWETITENDYIFNQLQAKMLQMRAK